MNKEFLKKTVEEADRGVKLGDGGPFGALVADEKGDIISLVHNEVYKTNDPTAHAEVMAIRRACEKLGKHTLEGCCLYTSCHPCPMCLSATVWAQIDKVYYAASNEDTSVHGFDDSSVYRTVKEIHQENGDFVCRGDVAGLDYLVPFRSFKELYPERFEND